MNGGGRLSLPSPRGKHFPHTRFQESLGEANQQGLLPGVPSNSPRWGSGLSFRTVSEEPRSAWAPTPDLGILEEGGFPGKRNEGDPPRSRGGGK